MSMNTRRGKLQQRVHGERPQFRLDKTEEEPLLN